MRYLLVAALLVAREPAAVAQSRGMQPDDLFKVERIGAIVWSPDGSRAAVEIHRPSRWLDRAIPTADIAVVEGKSGALRVVSRASASIIGFYRPAWSPNSRQLLFLSVDTDANIRPWMWTTAGQPASQLKGFDLQEGLADPPVGVWRDDDHAIFMLRDSTRPSAGPLYAAVNRGRNIADEWVRAREGREPIVSVVDSYGRDSRSASAPEPPKTRIVAVNVTTLATTTLVTGQVHRPSLSADGRVLTYRRENPALAVAPASTFFGPEAQGEAAYDAVNWGTEVHHVDARTGVPVPAPPRATPVSQDPTRPQLAAKQNRGDSTTLVLSRPGQPDVEVWKGNAWLKELKPWRTEAIEYTSATGSMLTGWLLYPTDYVTGSKIPIITLVYPGSAYSAREPAAFDPLAANFEHPQVFATRGYGVLLPSIPEAEKPLQVDGIKALTDAVLPLLDVVVARGIADPQRIGVLGQSAGGWAAMALVTATDRFRTAIASAGYSNLVSLYGSFYGQYRYGDSGPAHRGVLLRMLQFERGHYGAAAPPWEQPDRYTSNSPIARVANVRTPILLIQGDQDFVSIQQSEEFFTALYRQDKRASLVRYTGEGHTISAKPNVLDVWRRIDAWLAETMPAPSRF